MECTYEKQQNNKDNSSQALMQQSSIEKRIDTLKQKINQLKVDNISNPNYIPADDPILYPPLPMKSIGNIILCLILLFITIKFIGSN